MVQSSSIGAARFSYFDAGQVAQANHGPAALGNHQFPEILRRFQGCVAEQVELLLAVFGLADGGYNIVGSNCLQHFTGADVHGGYFQRVDPHPHGW